MAKIKDLPTLERPREKALRYGIHTLSPAELLAIIIGSGTVKSSAIDIANNLLQNFGGIKNLTRVNLNKLLTVKGVNNAIALKLLAAFELVSIIIKLNELDDAIYSHRIANLAEKYHALLIKKHQEEMYLVCFDKNQFVVNETMIYKGTQNGSETSIEEIISLVKECNCENFLVLHNHPNGNSEPSDHDIGFTYDLAMEAYSNKLHLIDHVIVTEKAIKSIFGLFE